MLNLNHINEEEYKQYFIDYIIATGQSINKIYNKYIYPFIDAMINLHIYNIEEEYQIDAKQHMHYLILKRIKKIDFTEIKSIKNLFFITCKRLMLNEIDKINVQRKVKMVFDKAQNQYINKCLYYHQDDYNYNIKM